MTPTGLSGEPLDVDKEAMIAAQRGGTFGPADTVRFARMGDGSRGPLGLDCSIQIDPRGGDRWRVTIADTWQMGAGFCHVADIRSASTSPLELLRLALNDYREYRPLSDRSS